MSQSFFIKKVLSFNDGGKFKAVASKAFQQQWLLHL